MAARTPSAVPPAAPTLPSVEVESFTRLGIEADGRLRCLYLFLAPRGPRGRRGITLEQPRSVRERDVDGSDRLRGIASDHL